MTIGVIIPAAGASRRFASDDPLSGPRSKLDEDLGGRPVLHRTVELFANRDDVAKIVVAGPADDEAYERFTLRHADKLGLLGVILCRGGAEHRYQTVQLALAALASAGADDITHVAVHDGARPAAPMELIDRVFRAGTELGHDAVVPGVEVADTLKRVGDEVDSAASDPLAAILGPSADSGANSTTAREVLETVDRSGLVGVQTPQLFEIGLLRRAYAQDDLTSTDDAQLIERLGERVVVVPGDARNIKITRPADIGIAKSILGLKGPAQRPTHKRF